MFAAVRITHEPSGMVANANNGRSMVKMRDHCKSILRSKLWHLENVSNEAAYTDAQREIAAKILARHRR